MTIKDLLNQRMRLVVRVGTIRLALKNLPYNRLSEREVLREELKASFPFIGRKLGGKDHTTAIHAYEKILKEVEKNENLSEEIELIKQRVLCG